MTERMIASKVESILFVAARPLSVKKLMELCDATKDEVGAAVNALQEKYRAAESGLRILRQGDEVQMGTSPEASATVQQFLKDETTGELTKPALETLTIVAYRGPISKSELEQIRGVNCSLILRNLMMRGLVEAAGEQGQQYSVSLDFIRFLGISNIDELPDYERLRSHEAFTTLLAKGEEKK